MRSPVGIMLLRLEQVWACPLRARSSVEGVPVCKNNQAILTACRKDCVYECGAHVEMNPAYFIRTRNLNESEQAVRKEATLSQRQASNAVSPILSD